MVRDFCPQQGIDFITLSYTGYLFLANVLRRVKFWIKCLKQGIKNRNSVFKQGRKINEFCFKQG